VSGAKCYGNYVSAPPAPIVTVGPGLRRYIKTFLKVYVIYCGHKGTSSSVSDVDRYIITKFFNFLLISWDGVRLCPLGTSATNWPILPAPDDRWCVWSSR
jgi:uncharacterized membrane protein